MTRLPLAQKHSKALENCTYCPKLCRAVCPVSAADRTESLTPWGKMSLTWMVNRGQVEATEETAAVAWGCTGCMACRDHCDHENPVAETLAAARADYFEQGLAPTAAKRCASEIDADAQERSAALASLSKMSGVEVKASVGLIFGCAYLKEPSQAAAAALRVASKLVGPVRIIDACCGLPSFLAGDLAGVARASRELDQALEGCTRVIALDPGCARFLHARHPEPLIPLVADFLDRLGCLELAQEELPVRYHDPCHLGRGLGHFEAPRAILTKILGRAPEEFSRNRLDGECSGGGGLLPQTAPETSARIARQRLDDHRDLGGGTVVTACGKSLRQFQQQGARVFDLISLVDRALGD